MSDDRDYLVPLGVAPERQHELADAITAWLRSSGWAVRDPEVLRLEFPAREPDLLGPNASGSVDVYRGTIACGVGDGMWSAMQDLGGPVCLACGTQVPDDEALPVLLAWVDGADEPEFTCGGCGARAFVGDMDTEYSLVVGNPGVIVVPDLDVEPGELLGRLRAELVAAFGGRWAHVHERI